MNPTEYDSLDAKYENDEELAEREYGEFVEWLSDSAAAELKSARGNSEATRQALARYYEAGFKANLSGDELLDFLCVSSESVLERAQLSDNEWDEILAINDSPEFSKEVGQASLAELSGTELETSLAQAFLPPPTPGTPNDEPVMRWAIRQYGKLIVSSPEMARRLSAIGHPFLENFYVDKLRALKIYAADLEKAFAEKPEFIIESFDQLAKIYEEKDESSANIFKERIANLPESEAAPQPAAARRDLGYPGMRIFIPTEYADLAQNLHHKIWKEIEDRQIHFKDLQFSKYESCSAQPRREFARLSLSGRDQNVIEEIAFKYLSEFNWPEQVFIEKEGQIEVWHRPAHEPVPTSQPAVVESPYGRMLSMLETPMEQSKYFHSIGFAGFVWDEIFQPAMKQQSETGRWPIVDHELTSALAEAFDSQSISHAVQSLATPICDWRDRAIYPQPDQVQGDESFIMRTGVAGEIDPYYIWSFQLATNLWQANVQPSCFQRFCDLHYSNLYAAEHFNVCRIADLMPELVYGENIDKKWLRTVINDLSRLLKETSQLASSGQTLFCHSFDPGAAPILKDYAVAMADLAKRV